MSPRIRSKGRLLALAMLPVLIAPVASLATDIHGVQPAALDQPRVNAIVSLSSGGDPLWADFGGQKAFNIQAFYDTGASGVLISANTAASLGTLGNPGVPQQLYNGKPVVYEDVGVAGSDRFNVSAPLNISIAPFHPNIDEKVGIAEGDFNSSGNPPSFQGIDLSYYNHTFTNVRTQVGQLSKDPANQDPFLDDLDVFGIPTMKGKVVVMDPKPVDALDTMRTYTYAPGTAYNASQPDSNPGIPKTTRTVKLSYGSFDKYSQTGTVDANDKLVQIPPAQVANYAPALEHNPFIGPNPVNPTGDTTPPVKIGYNGRSTTGSFLLDTGAAASIISVSKAQALGITVNDSDPNNPILIGVPADQQFQLTIGGVGGTKKVAGFYLSSLLVRTMEGNAANDNDPKHFRFTDAPVLVSNITVANPNNAADTLTLDGIFGMNFLVASAYVSEGGPGGLPTIGALTQGAFDWAVFDEPNGLLKLRPRLAGDANRDGTVDFLDLAALAQNYNGKSGTDDPWTGGDFNGDGIVDFLDLAAMAQHYNTSDLSAGDMIELHQFDLGFGAAAAGVPEPASGLVVLLGGCVMVCGRRRARK
ncbi:MAG: hypothetical protein JWN40_1810 [Phycisphaerales bacterium]|nr:hypothetical protein [Phycisphaerales bacterium]